MNAVGIDIGTTGICGVCVDTETGVIQRSQTQNSNAFLSSPNAWERIQSAEKILTVCQEILHACIDKDTRTIGITGQMHGILYTDPNGNAVSPLYTWQDGRGDLPYQDTTYADFLGSFSGYGHVTDFYNQIHRIRPQNAVSYCTIGDYLAMKLCGLKTPILHISNAASLGCFDIQKECFACDSSVRFVSDYPVIGTYHNIPVCAAIGDNQASVFSALTDKRDLLINIGTGSQISLITDHIIQGTDIEIRPYFEKNYLAVGAALCGGRAYSLLQSLFAEILRESGDFREEEVYTIMEKTARAISSPSLMVDTGFAGTRRDRKQYGSITGITTDNLRAGELVHGVINGMVKELYDLYQTLNLPFRHIVGSGNGIRKNPLLVNAIQEQFHASLRIPKHWEEAAYGAALIAMIASGIRKNAAEAQKLIQYQNENG